jgi:hypothetical protein
MKRKDYIHLQQRKPSERVFQTSFEFHWPFRLMRNIEEGPLLLFENMTSSVYRRCSYIRQKDYCYW